MATETITETFDTVGQHQLDIPAQAYNIAVTLEGAGGAGAPDTDAEGGAGGYVDGDLPQAAGEVLEIFVGGGGVVGGSGGFNGGGTGRNNSAQSGGGGGASDIRIGGTTLDDRVAVAGGGGGAAIDDYENQPVIGGDGGGLEGADGQSSRDPGTGGTQTSGGEYAYDNPDYDGAFGVGGDGADDDTPGGAGGGGWYGGGGGAGIDSVDYGGAGGGGSSYIDDLQNATTTTGGGAAGGVNNEDGSDGSVTITFDVDVDPAEDFQVDAERDTEIDLSWTAVDTDADGQRLYRSTVSGIDPSSIEPIADLGPDVESYTDTDLDNGTDYHYLLETYVSSGSDEATATSAEITGQTTIPDVDGFSLDASIQDELTVENFGTGLNTGRYRIRWKRSISDTYPDDNEETIPYDDPLEYVISPVLDGEQYDIGIRAETVDVDGTWHTAQEVTKLVPVSELTLTPTDDAVHNYDSDLELSWTVESEYDGTQQIWRYESTGEEPASVDDGELVATVDNQTVAYTDSAEAFQPGRDYIYTVRTQTQYVHADSAETFIASRAGLQAALYAEIDDPRRDEPIELDPPKAVRNAQIRHSATSNVDIATPDLGPALRTLAELNPDVDLRVHLIDSDGTLVRDDRIIKSVLGEAETQGQSNEATLKCKGRGWYLETSSPDNPVTFQNIRVWEAARKYGNEELDTWECDVQPDPGVTIADDEVGQAAETHQEWLDFLEEYVQATAPVVFDNGQFRQAQCSFALEAPTATSLDGTVSFAFEDYYSSGRGVVFDEEGDYINYTNQIFEVEHRLEPEDIGVAARPETDPVSGGDTNATVEFQLIDADDDSVVHSFNIYEGGDSALAFWHSWSDDVDRDMLSDVGEWTGPAVEPGQYYVRLECTEAPTGDGNPVVIDMVAPLFDDRFSYDWEEDPHEDEGYLDGPEPYPTVEFELPLVDRETNIERARIESTWTNSSGFQAIALSNDNGDNWVEAENAEVLEANFGEQELFGSQLRARFTFSGHPIDSDPQDETPRFRYEPQAVESYELRFDQSSVAVIDELTLSDSHKENINTLCGRGRLNWVVDHTADGRRLEIFPNGVEAPDADRVEWSALDWSRTDGSFEYANRVVTRGARKPDEEREDENDLRYEGVVQDDEEIQRRLDEGVPTDKATVTRTILDPELESAEEVQQQAFNTLEDLVEERQPSGSLDVVPTFIKPGYAYPVEEFEGADGNVPTKVLEQVTVSQEFGSASGSLEFEPPRNWVRAVDPLERDVGGLKRLF